MVNEPTMVFPLGDDSAMRQRCNHDPEGQVRRRFAHRGETLAYFELVFI